MFLKFFLYMSLFILSIDKNNIYLTIDDGPSSITNELCDLLLKYDVKATFFVLGENVKKYPQALKYIYNNGHLVANHTYSHKNFYKIKANRDLLETEIKKAEEEIVKLINYKPIYLRYPYGYSSKQAIEVARFLGYKVINWSFGYDWHPYSEDKIISEYIKNLKPGSIILVHDTPKRNKMVLRVVEEIFKEAKKKNLKFVKIDELN